MNAPRQGLFASLLIVSFALHTFLLVIATTHQLNENRASQGQLMTSQLVADSLTELEPANTVSLALLANRYATHPSVASIRILNANQQLLATGGMAKTRSGEVFVRDALQNEKKVGSIEITLIQPSIGEILRNQWLAIFASLFIHGLIWLAYRAVARPTRSEYLARINQENHLKHEIQRLTQTLALEKQNSVTLIAQAQQQAKAAPKPLPNHHSNNTAFAEDSILALSIQFDDHKQLLNSVNQSVSMPYFKLCQLFLDKSIALCSQHYQIDAAQIQLLEPFNAEGVSLSTGAEQPHALECLMMVGAVFQLLADVLYKRYREDKRFALQTRAAVANRVDAMQLDAVEAAKRLAQHLEAKQAALHLNHAQLKHIQDCYELVAMPNPSNIMTRQAFIINGMNEQCATLAQNLRTEILMGKKAKTIEESADISTP